MSVNRCPACQSTRLQVFHEQASIPAHSCLLLPTREEALTYPRGSLRLAACQACGFITNTIFDPSLNAYGSEYEETQGFSPRFLAFARSLAQRWVTRYGLRRRDIVEIGCGKGEFLDIICELGDNRGVGIDPSVRPERLPSASRQRLRFLPELYAEHHRDLPADAIICRHTLEHIHSVADFVGGIRRTIGDRRDTVVLFEVPDVLRVLDEIAFWDIYYEHCSYFTPGSLARLFRRSGFEVLNVELDYDDQYILLEARPIDGATEPRMPLEDDLARTLASVERFVERNGKALEARRTVLRRYQAEGKRVTIWGAGSKGVAFLTTLGDETGIEVAIDINPNKHGMYLAGTGQQIVAPEYLVEYRPDVVLIMNPIYTDEIRARLDGLGVTAELVPV